MDNQTNMTPWYRQPVWLGLLGIVLVVGGYKLSTYIPEPDSPGAKFIAELDEMARGQDEAFREKLSPFVAQPPFRWSGRIVLLVGVALSIAAMIVAGRSPRRAERPDSEDATDAA